MLTTMSVGFDFCEEPTFTRRVWSMVASSTRVGPPLEAFMGTLDQNEANRCAGSMFNPGRTTT